MRQPGCQVGSVMSRRNLSKDEKGHLKHEKAVKGWWGQIQTNPSFPRRILKNLHLFFFCFFWLLAGGKRNSPAVYFLDVKGGGKQGGESRLAEQHQTIRAISLGLADPSELILAQLQFGVFTTERLFLNTGWVWRERSL